jgi:hypothetical protein
MIITTQTLYQSLLSKGLIIVVIYFDELAKNNFLAGLGVTNDEAPFGCHVGTLKVGEQGEKDIDDLFVRLAGGVCDVVVVVSSNGDYCSLLAVGRVIHFFERLRICAYRIVALSNQGEQYTVERIANCNAITPDQAGKHLKYAIKSGYGLSSFAPMTEQKTSNQVPSNTNTVGNKPSTKPNTSGHPQEDSIVMGERVLPIKDSQQKKKGVIAYIRIMFFFIAIMILTINTINFFYPKTFQGFNTEILTKHLLSIGQERNSSITRIELSLPSKTGKDNSEKKSK